MGGVVQAMSVTERSAINKQRQKGRITSEQIGSLSRSKKSTITEGKGLGHNLHANSASPYKNMYFTCLESGPENARADGFAPRFRERLGTSYSLPSLRPP